MNKQLYPDKNSSFHLKILAFHKKTKTEWKKQNRNADVRKQKAEWAAARRQIHQEAWRQRTGFQK